MGEFYKWGKRPQRWLIIPIFKEYTFEPALQKKGGNNMVLPAFEKVGVAQAQDEPTDSSGSLIVLNLYGELVEIRTRFFCPSGYRILDMLNREDGTGSERNAFIDLIDMDTKEETHLRKETIQFVAVDDAGAGRGFSSDPAHRQFPYWRKTR
jgi:hypothetical protein